MDNVETSDSNLIIISKFRKVASLLSFGMADLLFFSILLILFYYLLNNGFKGYYGWALLPGLAGSSFFLIKCSKVTVNIILDRPMIFIKDGMLVAYDSSMTNIFAQDVTDIVAEGNYITIFSGSDSKRIGIGLGTAKSDTIVQLYKDYQQ
jgi:hypothetical protein